MPAFNDDAIGQLPPELLGSLTFHLPMELAALRLAGAPDAIVDQRRTERLHDAWRDGLVDPPLYRWAVQRYAPTASDLLSRETTRVRAAVDDIAPLGDGLAGAAFHGLIRLGYGLRCGEVAEVSRGLAYMRTRRQVLRGDRHGSVVATVARDADMPDEAARDNVTVFDLLDLAAAASVADDPFLTTRALGVAAVAMVRRNPSSFVAVHACTGLHALCELDVVANGTAGVVGFNGVVRSWWSAFETAARACDLLIRTTKPEATAAYDGRYGHVHDVVSLVAASWQSPETHDVKLAVALQRLVEFGLVTDEEAVSAATARLGAAELRTM